MNGISAKALAKHPEEFDIRVCIPVLDASGTMIIVEKAGQFSAVECMSAGPITREDLQ